MAIFKNISLLITTILLLTLAVQAYAQKKAINNIDIPVINCLDVALPVTFSWVNYDYPPEDVPPVPKEKIKSIIVDFFLESNAGDSEEIFKAKDYYFTTLRMPFNNLVLFAVILKTPLAYSHCKLFLYDSVKKTVSKKVIDYNIWAMYSVEDNGMKRSDLFKSFQLNDDDMMLAPKNKQNLLLERLKHNGTYNELEETIYKVNGLSLDTVSTKAKILDE